MDDVRMVKNLLASYKDASRRALQLEIEIEQLRLDSTTPGGVKYDDMPKAHRIHDLSDYAAKADALLAELQRQYGDILDKKKLVARLIEEAPTEQERLILWYRYIKLRKDGRLMSYEEIAVQTHYSFGSINHILGMAHRHLAEKWPEISEKYDKVLPS